MLWLLVATLVSAKAHLAQGKLDAVLLDLEEAQGAPADEAAVLVKAAEQAKQRGDEPLALQLAQVAARRDPAAVQAVRDLGAWSLAAREFAAARKYADAWLARAPEDEDAKRFSLKVKLLDESWHPALLEPPRKRAREKHPGIVGYHPERTVTVYGTSWCGYCKKARAWLSAHGVAYDDKDIEQDPRAAEELATKESRAGVRYGGVPIIDVGGTLIEGFDEARLAQLTRTAR